MMEMPLAAICKEHHFHTAAPTEYACQSHHCCSCRLPYSAPACTAPAAERLRREIEAARDSIAVRAAELASLTTGLGQQQAAATAAMREAAVALAAREVELAAAAERLRLLQAQRQEARQALEAAESAREQGALGMIAQQGF
jgi:septal ring factor EnvC (AmiA/AmiB activator)